MTYTISTEPVTREHIGTNVIVRNHDDHHSEDCWIPGTLRDILLIEDGGYTVKYHIHSSMQMFDEALLIVEEDDRKS